MLEEWFGRLWLVLAVVWVVAAFNSKRTVRREGLAGRISHGVLLALAWYLLFAAWHLPPLNVRFVPDTSLAAFSGLALTAAGVGFAIWARFTIGSNWSGRVTLKQDHQLIRQGPYRIVRHPIYSGILLATAGTALGYGRVTCVIGLLTAFVALWMKSRTEESFMRAQFGEVYLKYQGQVKALIPGVF